MKQKGKPEGRKMSGMSRHQKILIGIAITFLLYSVIGFIVLPNVLKNTLEKRLSENLKRPVSIKAIQFNPYLLKISVNDFLVKNRDQNDEFVAFDQLFIDLEAISVLKRALVIRTITLSRPRANLTRYEDLTYNFSDIGAVPKQKKKTEAKPVLFSLNNIEIKNGSVVFTDEPKDRTHRITNFDIAVPYLSNILHEIEINVKPAFSAIINDTPVKLTGKTIPFHETRRTVFNIQADKLNIPEYLAYFPSAGDLTLKSGQLDITAVLGFEMQPGNIPALTLNGKFSLHGIDVAEIEGESYLTIPKFDIKLLEAKPLEQNFHLSSITISGPEFLLRRRNDGSVLPLAFLPETQKSETPESETDRETSLKLVVDEIVINSGTVHFEDRANNEPFTTTLDPVEIKISNLSTLEDAQATYNIALQSEAEESVVINGKLSLYPMATQLHVALQNLQAPRFRPYYADFITPQVKNGRLDLAADLHYSKPDETGIIQADNISVQLTSLAINNKEGANLLTVPSLSITESSIDMTDRRIVIGNFSGNDSELRLVRQQDGTVNLNQLLKPAPQDSKPEAAGAAPSEEWTAILQKSEINGFSIIFQDNVPSEPTTIIVDKIRLAAADISTIDNMKGTVDLGLRIDKKSDVSVKGKLGIKPLSAALVPKLAALPVKTLQPYFSDKVNLVISEGVVSADGQLKITSDDSNKLSILFQGNAGVADLSSFDPVVGEEFLKWKDLSLTEIDYDSERSALRIREISWLDFYNKIVVFEDGAVNLKAVLKETDNPETTAQLGKNASESTGEGEKSLLVEIGTVSLKNGQFDFLDRNITPHYSTSLSEISGTITGLSSQTGVMGEVNISSRLDQHAPLSISGRINPLSEELFADLVVDFKDIELSPTSPYTGKFIGYTVAKGKLSLDLKYLVEGSKIHGKNEAFLDQFTLGDSVDSPDAISLPINLAISLLKNRKGEITLNVPVKGDLDDPEFSIGGIVFKAIINLIAKAATSPFALLGALIPEGEDLQHLDFTSGSSLIGEEYVKKLETIAKVLYDRPGLKMDIKGGFNAEEERKVLHEMEFARLLKNEKFKEVTKKKGETASLAEITVEPEEYKTYLKKAYKAATFQKPKNALGFTKRLPPAEMEKLLRDNITVTDDDLRLLAIQRANAVKSYLVETGGIEPERLFILEPQAGEGETGVPQVEMTIK
ncbi:MAG: DUF748 domain-containing protein [Deltaproteobacteria bacterium]|nr:DUF748 domain-containing protein [Deltaproteobacteria bacterium]